RLQRIQSRELRHLHNDGKQRELRQAVVQQQYRLSGADGTAGTPARLLRVGHIRPLAFETSTQLSRSRSVGPPIDRDERARNTDLQLFLAILLAWSAACSLR